MSVEVAGQYCLASLAEHERSCLLLIEEEQRKANPDTRLIAVLCDSVRLTRETEALAKRLFS